MDGLTTASQGAGCKPAAQCAVAGVRWWHEDRCHHQLSTGPPCPAVLKSLLWSLGSAFSYAFSCYSSEQNSSSAKSYTIKLFC